MKRWLFPIIGGLVLAGFSVWFIFTGNSTSAGWVAFALGLSISTLSLIGYFMERHERFRK